MHFGFILQPETGEYLARVKDGKILTMDERKVLYRIVDDMIVANDGTELGYLSSFTGLTSGTGDLANHLFPPHEHRSPEDA
jgi:hypothetical protein